MPQITVINVMDVATGITTPYTKIIKDLNQFSTQLHYLSLKVDNIYVCLKKVVSDLIEDKMLSNGHLSADALASRMYEFHN